MKELIEEAVRSITPGDWARCVDYVLSLERGYWANEIAVEDEHEPVVIELASDSVTAAQTQTLPARQGACEIALY